MVTYRILAHETAHDDGKPVVLANVEFHVGGAPREVQFRFYAEDSREAYSRMEAKRFEFELQERAASLAAREQELASRPDPIAEARKDLIGWLTGHVAGATEFPPKPKPPVKTAEEEAAAAA